jgi:predicted nucleic acid-binding protein
MIYLDSAAIVKLVHAEPKSQALRGWLDERAETGWISSALVEIESFRALVRYAPDAVSRLPAVLDLIALTARQDLRHITPARRFPLTTALRVSAAQSPPSLPRQDSNLEPAG